MLSGQACRLYVGCSFISIIEDCSRWWCEAIAQTIRQAEKWWWLWPQSHTPPNISKHAIRDAPRKWGQRSGVLLTLEGFDKAERSYWSKVLQLRDEDKAFAPSIGSLAFILFFRLVIAILELFSHFRIHYWPSLPRSASRHREPRDLTSIPKMSDSVLVPTNKQSVDPDLFQPDLTSAIPAPSTLESAPPGLPPTSTPLPTLSSTPVPSFASPPPPWATITISTPQNPLIDGRYQETLFVESTPLTTVTVQVSPSLLLIVGDETIQTGTPASTTDNIVIFLAPERTTGTTIISPAILFYTDGSVPPFSVPSTTTRPGETSTNAPASDPGISSGAIAGIAIAGVLVLALIVGGWFFWRRRKRRAQPSTNTLTDDELARREGDGDKVVLDPHQTAPTTGAYQTQYQEMSGNGLTQELDRSHSYKFAIGGAHELKADDRPGELPFAGIEEHGSTDDLDVVDGAGPEMTQVPQTNRTATQAPQVSLHVEAQRRREVEWLEAEEMRMRQRREALLQQSGGKTEQ